MAGALYRIEYAAGSAGAAVVYIGEDGVTGLDSHHGVYSGQLSVTDRARGTISIHYPQSAQLITGESVPAGGNVTVRIDCPSDLILGEAVEVNFSGVMLKAKFMKISDIPISSGR